METLFELELVPGGTLQREVQYGTFHAYGNGQYLGVFKTKREATYEVAREARRQLEAAPRCPDCGECGERKGHQTCQYPQD